MTGFHTHWVRPPEQPEDPERIAIREALAFGKAQPRLLVVRTSCRLSHTHAEMSTSPVLISLH